MKKTICCIALLCTLLTLTGAAALAAGTFTNVATPGDKVTAAADENSLELTYSAAQSGKEYVILVTSAALEEGKVPTVSTLAYIAQKTGTDSDGVSFQIRSRKIQAGETYYAYLASNADSGVTSREQVASFAYATEETYLLGDVNNDNDIDSRDALLTLRIAAETLEDVTEAQRKAANVNSDEVVDSRDALLILRKAAFSDLNFADYAQ